MTHFQHYILLFAVPPPLNAVLKSFGESKMSGHEFGMAMAQLILLSLSCLVCATRKGENDKVSNSAISGLSGQ
jgi:hypothetical protein